VAAQTHVVLDVRLAAGEKKDAASLVVAVLAAQMEGREAAAVLDVGVSPARATEEVRGAREALPGGLVQGRVAVLKDDVVVIDDWQYSNQEVPFGMRDKWRFHAEMMGGRWRKSNQLFLALAGLRRRAGCWLAPASTASSPSRRAKKPFGSPSAEAKDATGRARKKRDASGLFSQPEGAAGGVRPVDVGVGAAGWLTDGGENSEFLLALALSLSRTMEVVIGHFSFSPSRTSCSRRRVAIIDWHWNASFFDFAFANVVICETQAHSDVD